MRCLHRLQPIRLTLLDRTSPTSIVRSSKIPIHVDKADLASSVFHKLVQINVDIGFGRLDYACEIG